MARWGFVSDIHGNERALEAAAHRLRDLGAERFICLGDVIGRGAPEACAAWVRATASLAIVGNRDLDYLERVSPELRTVVLSWPNEAVASNFILSHGDPHLHRVLNSAAERTAFARVPGYLQERGARVWFFGHTHRSRAWVLGPDGASELTADEIVMDPEQQYVVNVGTTGLPLPGRGAGACALYDDVAHTIVRVPVPAAATTRNVAGTARRRVL